MSEPAFEVQDDMKRTKDQTGRESPDPATDNVSIRPLGAGQEVGRSCWVLRYQGKGVMFDCGIHPAHSGAPSELWQYDRRLSIHNSGCSFAVHAHDSRSGYTTCVRQRILAIALSASLKLAHACGP